MARLKAQAAATDRELHNHKLQLAAVQQQLDEAIDANNALKSQAVEQKKTVDELRNMLTETRMDADDHQAKLDEERVCSCPVCMHPRLISIAAAHHGRAGGRKGTEPG